MKMFHEDEEISTSPRSSGDEIWVNTFDEESAQRFREQVMERARKSPMLLIPIYIDSYGGNADSLAKMIETMDEVPNRFVTIAMGKAISCGAILFSHGDMRFCGRYSRIMIHNVSGMSWGDIYALQASGEEAMRLNKIFMGLLAKNCGISYEDLQKEIKNSLDSKEIWLDAEQAVKFGIADEVGLPEITPFIQFACNTLPPKPSMEEEMEMYKAQEKLEKQAKATMKKPAPKKPAAKKPTGKKSK